MGPVANLCICAVIALADAGVVPKFEGPSVMEAGEGEFPSMAIILNKKTRYLITSGVLIRPRVVLTLGYNYYKDSLAPEDIIVAVGMHNRSMIEPSRQEFNVSQILIHPEMIETWQSTKVPDIALIQLAEDVETNRRAKTFALNKINSDPKLDKTLRNLNCITYGYGRIKWNEYEIILPRTLQTHNPEVQSFKTCDEFSTSIGFPWSNKHWLCTINTDLTTSRPGDGGNPLLCESGGDLILFGITSGGTQEMTGFSYHTRLSMYRDWIVNNAKQLQR